ncbi:MAG: hypothetical protein GIW95_03410 [Candidatus Eremiobacteraeota bacterium]|nr:hypothetical protein [Candidatus Eremiobacteraeota bacterium]
MQDARFFQSTRGKIVTALRRRHTASAIELAGEFGLSANAVRQQLVALERDGYVVERAVRRGPTKPTLEYSLTADAESLFPQQYEKMLNALLREVKSTLGPAALSSVLEGMSKRASAKFTSQVTAGDLKGKVTQLAAALRDNGVEAEVIDIGGALELREHNCPYSKTVGEHPEVCSIIHTVLRDTVGGEAKQTESIATGGDSCRFEISSTQRPGASAVR